MAKTAVEPLESQIASAVLSKFRAVDMRSGLFPGELSIRARVIAGEVHTRVELVDFPVDDLENVIEQIMNQFNNAKNG